MKVAVALSGGGFGGIAFLGVKKALFEWGLDVTALAGTSAGALMAGLWAEDMSVCQLEDMLFAQKPWHWFSIAYGTFVKAMGSEWSGEQFEVSHLLHRHPYEQFLQSHFQNKTFDDLPIPLFMPATDLISQKEILFGRNESQGSFLDKVYMAATPVRQAILASSAFPGLFAPVPLGSYLLADGGIVDDLPGDLLATAGYTTVLSIRVFSSTYDGRKSNFWQNFMRGAEIMQGRLIAKQNKGHLLIEIELPDLWVTSANVHQLINCGYEGMQQEKKRILEWF